jgi:hypothetical protein
LLAQAYKILLTKFHLDDIALLIKAPQKSPRFAGFKIHF